MSWLVTPRRRTQRPHPGRTYVYRLYSRSGALLYIGITNSPRHRFPQHAADKPWWRQVDQRATTLRTYETRNQALRAEEYAIKTEGPIHNKVHNPAWGGTYVGERPTDRIARPIAASGVCLFLLAGAWLGWWWVPIGPQVLLGAGAMLAARLAWLRW